MKLKAEGDCIVGVVASSEVVRVSDGVDHFTAVIENEPDNPFAYLMRCLLWLDKREFEIALGDAEDAVRLAPNAARVYCARGQVRAARREYEKRSARLQ